MLNNYILKKLKKGFKFLKKTFCWGKDLFLYLRYNKACVFLIPSFICIQLSAFIRLVNPFTSICCMLSYRSCIARYTWLLPFNGNATAESLTSVLRQKSASQTKSCRCAVHSYGFTLTEVIITLTILGVVAVLTVPNIVQRYNERVTVTKLRKAYSTVNNVLTIAQLEHGPISTWDIGESATAEGARKIYKIIEPYFKIKKYCDNNMGECTYNGYYKLLDGRQAWTNLSNNFIKFVLMDGTTFTIWSNGNQNCRNGLFCFSIFIDINGSKAPNKFGVDFFMLRYLYATPEKTDASEKMDKNDIQCNIKSTTGDRNGRDCFYWILYKGNMDYLRRDITEELKSFGQ